MMNYSTKQMIVIYDAKRRESYWSKIFNREFIHNGSFLVSNSFDGKNRVLSGFSNGNTGFSVCGYYFLSDNSKSVSLESETKHIEDYISSHIPVEWPLLLSNGAYLGVMSMGAQSVLFNDFLGLQTVYEYRVDDAIVYSTSIRLLVKAFKLEKDPDAIEEYLITGALYSGRSGFKGVSVLSPSTGILIDDKGIKQFTYASFSDHTESNASLSDSVELMYQELNKAVKRLYIRSLKYSMSVTGGMDSRLIYLNWPDRMRLFTETAGEGTSDYLKARQIVSRIGNIDLHELEPLVPGDIEGIEEYYKACDNPLLAKGHHNMKHALWKMGRGAQIHVTGVGGEYLGGENLYTSRAPAYVLKEALSSYSYVPLIQKGKAAVFSRLLHYRDRSRFFKGNQGDLSWESISESSVKRLDTFLGVTKFNECYLERLRTLHLANAAYYLTGSLENNDFSVASPYFDRILINSVSHFYPHTRELRKSTIRVLQKFDEVKDIPIDTTHLPISFPYSLHKVFRTLRMVMNIGMQKKIPLLQKGDPPMQRGNPYFKDGYPEYRTWLNDRVASCQLLESSSVRGFIDKIAAIRGTNYYINHGVSSDLSLLLRISYFADI